jgi:hypothetical protein
MVLVAIVVSTQHVSAQKYPPGRTQPSLPGLKGTPVTLMGTPVVPGAPAKTEAAVAIDGTDATVSGTAAAGPSVVRAASSARSASDATEEALKALSGHVVRMSDSRALRTAFQAYFNYRAARPEAVRKPYLYFIDLGLDNRTRRGYVFDMENLRLVDGPFTVAHGNGSSRSRDGVPTRFSNRAGSKSSSLGLYLAQETYGFSGKSGVVPTGPRVCVCGVNRASSTARRAAAASSRTELHM